MEFRDLTPDEKILLKQGIMSLYENMLISQIAASWLIHALDLAHE